MDIVQEVSKGSKILMEQTKKNPNNIWIYMEFNLFPVFA